LQATPVGITSVIPGAFAPMNAEPISQPADRPYARRLAAPRGQLERVTPARR
jgi:hypothetical protein